MLSCNPHIARHIALSFSHVSGDLLYHMLSIYLQSLYRTNFLQFLLRPGRGAEYCDQPVCPRAYLWNCLTNQHEILSADPLWPWLSPHLAALRYVVYFWFYG